MNDENRYGFSAGAGRSDFTSKLLATHNGIGVAASSHQNTRFGINETFRVVSSPLSSVPLQDLDVNASTQFQTHRRSFSTPHYVNAPPSNSYNLMADSMNGNGNGNSNAHSGQILRNRGTMGSTNTMHARTVSHVPIRTSPVAVGMTNTPSLPSAAPLGTNIVSLCKDQNGCRFLQKQLETQPNAQQLATAVFNEVLQITPELMRDQFANYLMQKLIVLLLPAQRLALLKTCAPQLIIIAKSPHGTRALQKLIERISTPTETLLLVQELSHSVCDLALDVNGNHVLQKLLTKFHGTPQTVQFVYDALAQDCVRVSCHKHGCCVVQRSLDYGSLAQIAQISRAVALNGVCLATDPFGNYVVQYTVKKGDDRSVEMLIETAKLHVFELSVHKFGSNVIEKILRTASKSVAESIVARFIELDKKSETSVLLSLISDPYGNYVLQTVLDLASEAQFLELKSLIVPVFGMVRGTAQGKRVGQKIGL